EPSTRSLCANADRPKHFRSVLAPTQTAQSSPRECCKTASQVLSQLFARVSLWLGAPKKSASWSRLKSESSSLLSGRYSYSFSFSVILWGCKPGLGYHGQHLSCLN